jgi:alpha,alpha-trehalose phosphorylase
VFLHPSFSVEPWVIRETTLDLSILAQTESIFALSNGHIGLRGNLDEGEPHALPGTYLNGVYELRPLPYAEAGYGYPESGQTMVNITNSKIIRLLVDDEPFDVAYGELVSHQRTLDLRTGLLHREAEWCSPAHARVKVRSTRMVSLVQRSIVAVRYEVEAVDTPVRLVVLSELVANEELPTQAGDPRVAAALESSLRSEEYLAEATAALLIHRVKQSGILLGASMDHEVQGSEKVTVTGEAIEDVARLSVVDSLEPGQVLGLTKYVSYGWSARRSRPALHDQIRGALLAARASGWDGLVDEQRAFLDDFWSRVDVEIEGDPEVQQAVRFATFHVLQAAGRAEGRPIPAKGLTGTGYDGHTFWDMEIYVLNVLGFALPGAMADALRWRHSTLPAAQARARQLGLTGAAFPWRTIDGDECSAYWPAGTAAVHIGADIAYATVRYVGVTGDETFEADVGIELLVETARLWCALGHYEWDGTYRIDGVTGPDEYSALADNNVYTNLMAQLNLRAAADVSERYPERAAALAVSEEEIAAWRQTAASMYVPYDERLAVHPQAEGFTQQQEWDFAAMKADDYPLLLHYPYFDLYRKQVVKQADLVLAMRLRSDAFTADEKVRNFAYYERLTVRDSSLSACTQAVLAAEIGHLDLAYDYIAEAALMDLADIEHNTSDGLHIASLAGAWTAIVEGLGGLRMTDSMIFFAPRLPPALSRLRFGIMYRGRRLRVTVEPETATYQLVDGRDMKFSHYTSTVSLTMGAPVSCPIPPTPVLPSPSQPPGRAPIRRQLSG